MKSLKLTIVVAIISIIAVGMLHLLHILISADAFNSAMYLQVPALAVVGYWIFGKFVVHLINWALRDEAMKCRYCAKVIEEGNPYLAHLGHTFCSSECDDNFCHLNYKCFKNFCECKNT